MNIQLSDPSCTRVHFISAMLLMGLCVFGLGTQLVFAGLPPQVDLSVSVVVTPDSFVPGGRQYSCLDRVQQWA